MKLVRMALYGDAVIAEGDTDDPADFAYLGAVVKQQTEGGMLAVIPTTGLDACCRRGIVVDRFSDVRRKDLVVFLRRCRR